MTFETTLLGLIGTADDAFDIKAIVRRCFFYDLDGYPLRIWDGQGVLYAGGYEWLGTRDAQGTSHHITPRTRDVRDGTSPRYEFTVPYVDEATFLAMKADQDIARGRDLCGYQCVIGANEGLRPATALWLDYKLTIQGVEFSEAYDTDTLTRTVRVLARGEYGRSHAPFGTYTSTNQNERARVLDENPDSGCDFVAGLANRTYVISGG